MWWLVFALGCETPNRETKLQGGWVKIRGGTFDIGQDGDRRAGPAHSIQVPTFWIRRTEVTVDEYKACVDAGVCLGDPPGKVPQRCNWAHRGERGDHPMNCLDWQMADNYCTWTGARLATESEWEFAATSRGTRRPFPWGKAEPSCTLAHTTACEPKITRPVCSLPAGHTQQDLCDMAGNAYEWTLDAFQDNYTDHPTHGGATLVESEFRALRGGGIGSDEPLTVYNRAFHAPEFYYSGMGTRCVYGPSRSERTDD